MNAHQHFAEGEALLGEAEKNLHTSPPRLDRTFARAALAEAHFRAAQAAVALQGPWRDPAEELRGHDAEEARLAADARQERRGQGPGR